MFQSRNTIFSQAAALNHFGEFLSSYGRIWCAVCQRLQHGQDRVWSRSTYGYGYALKEVPGRPGQGRPQQQMAEAPRWGSTPRVTGDPLILEARQRGLG